MRCEEYIPTGHENAVSRQYLRDITGMSDRTMRQDLKSSQALILNLQDGKGYFKPGPGEERLVRAFIRQEEARMRSIQDTVKKAQNFLDYARQIEEDQNPGQLNMKVMLGW